MGAVACDIVRGNHRPQEEQIQPFRVTGVDGVGYHLLGKGGGEYVMTVVEYAAPVLVTIWHQSLVAQVGQVITIQNDWGEVQQAMCLGVSALNKQPAVDEGGCRGEATVRLQAVS